MPHVATVGRADRRMRDNGRVIAEPGRRIVARRYVSAWIGFSAGGRFSQALSTAIVVFAFGAPTVHVVLGTAGTWAVLASLVVLAGLSLLGQRYRIEWHGVLPLSLLGLVGYMALSVLWSTYSWASLRGFTATVLFIALGLYLALGRDLVQLVRASGDAFRILMVTSLGLEVLSGLVIDVPITSLGIQGNIAYGGPIQGVGGTRNFMGFIAGMALVTFVMEWLTRSVTAWRAIGSTAMALIALMLVQSPITSIAMVALVVAALAIAALRRSPADRRPVINTVLGALVAAAVVVAFVFRGRILGQIGAAGGTETRIVLWQRIRLLSESYPIQGWGWVGTWPTDVFPFNSLLTDTGRPYTSGLNALVDAWLQLGLAGAVILLATAALAFARAWVTATTFPGVAYVWPAVVLVLIGVTSAAESYLLHGAGLMMFVAVLVIAARRRSWRSRLRRT
jgi:O-antigen ligase